MLINAIALFEKGYFDAAFYMLRQTLEICMLMSYFLELPDDEREKEFSDWKGSAARFPGVKDMRKKLETSNYSIDFKDFKAKLPGFFTEFQDTYAKLNKFTHKQGFRYFYSIRWRKGYDKEIDIKLREDFIKYLDRCIGCAFMFRLMIDPLPILRMDEEIEYRIADPMMFPLSAHVIKRYIGEKRLEEYKTTNLYVRFRDDILKNREKMTDATYAYVVEEYLPRVNIPGVMKQAHLLTLRQRIQLMLIASFPQIAVIHTYDGMWSCFTDVKSNCNSLSSSSEEFRALQNSAKWENQPYKGVYATVVKVHGEFYTLEHNEPLGPLTVMELGKYAAEIDKTIAPIT